MTRYATVRLRELMAALPAKQREALQLRYFAGLDYSRNSRDPALL